MKNEPHFRGHFPGYANHALASPSFESHGADCGCDGWQSRSKLADKEHEGLFHGPFDKLQIPPARSFPGTSSRMELTTLRGKAGGQGLKFSGVASVEGEMPQGRS